MDQATRDYLRTELESKKKELEKKICNLRESVDNASKSLNAKLEEVKRIDQALKDLEHSDELRDIKVTDHAMVRFMQRHMNLDLQSIVEDIQLNLTPVYTGGGTADIKYGKGYFVVRDYSLITFIVNKGDKH